MGQAHGVDLTVELVGGNDVQPKVTAALQAGGLAAGSGESRLEVRAHRASRLAHPRRRRWARPSVIKP
jgi:hypothetical protein